MLSIRFPTRRTRAIEVIHPTAPRVGVFAQTARLRSTGPQAHLSPYIADEEHAVRRQVMEALGKFAAICAGLYLGLAVGRPVWHLVRGWIAL